MWNRLALLLAFVVAPALSSADDPSLLPKYGGVAKTAEQRSADEAFLAAIDQQFRGDRKAASVDSSNRGWIVLRLGRLPDAMRRFNQAWLLDPTNGNALWGMAVLQANREGHAVRALPLFAEAERLLPNDVNFYIDQARAMGIAAAETKDGLLLVEALRRVDRLHRRAPHNVLNLQNWAITLYYVGNYAEAWKKVRLAEATPRKGDLDPKFIAALQARSPRTW